MPAPPDEVLIEAAADAIERGKILFLLDTPTESVGRIANQTRTLVLAKLRDRFGHELSPSELLARVFAPSDNEWVLKTADGGWLFFYPASILNADDEVNNPTAVYWPTARGEYAKVSYSVWQSSRRSGNIWRTAPAARRPEPRGPKTAWDRILDNDDDFGE